MENYRVNFLKKSRFFRKFNFNIFLVGFIKKVIAQHFNLYLFITFVLVTHTHTHILYIYTHMKIEITKEEERKHQHNGI